MNKAYKIGTPILDPLYIRCREILGVVSDVKYYSQYKSFIYKAQFHNYSLWLSQQEISIGIDLLNEYNLTVKNIEESKC